MKLRVLYIFAAYLICSTAVAGGQELSTLLTRDRLAAAVIYSKESREIEEYDDLWSGSNTEGDFESSDVRAELQYRAATNLFIKIRAGIANVDMDGFEREAYAQSYNFGSMIGVGIQTDLLPFPDLSIPVRLSFDYDWTGKDSDDTIKGKLSRWNVSASILKKYCQLLLQAGIRYSDLEVVYEHPRGNKTRQGGFEAIDHVGLKLGAEYKILDNLSVSASFTAVDSTGFNISMKYQF